MGHIRNANNLCPIFKDTDTRVDIGSDLWNVTAGTLTASSLIGTLVIRDNLGTVLVALPTTQAVWGTATSDATVLGLTANDMVIVVPISPMPSFAQFSAAEAGEDKIIFEFYNESGEASAMNRDFVWRKVTNN